MPLRRTYPSVGFRGTLEQRFMNKVVPEPNSGCWLWFGAVDRKGYGQIRMPGRAGEAKHETAPRVSWKLSGRDIPSGLHVLHRCDTPGCVNPSHLFLGTHVDNMRDRDAKGRNSKPPRAKKGQGKKEYCKRGHPLAGSNIRYVPNGDRRCVACEKIRKAKFREHNVSLGLLQDGGKRKVPFKGRRNSRGLAAEDSGASA